MCNVRLCCAVPFRLAATWHCANFVCSTIGHVGSHGHSAHRLHYLLLSVSRSSRYLVSCSWPVRWDWGRGGACCACASCNQRGHIIGYTIRYTIRYTTRYIIRYIMWLR